MTLSFFVPGIPAPQGSKRHVGRGILVESSKACGPWRAVVRQYADVQAQVAKWAIRDKKQPLYVSCTFTFTRPKGTKKSAECVVRPDVDKLLRAILDACTGVLWGDDSQVISLRGEKRYCVDGDRPGIFLVVDDVA